MICTAAIGVLLVLVKHSLPEGSLAGNVEWGEVFGVVCVFMTFSAFICIPCIWLALADEHRVLWAVWLVIVGFGGPPFVFATLVMMFGAGPSAAEVITAIFLFGLGAAGTTFLVLLIIRSLGYRLVCTAPDFPGPQAGDSTTEAGGTDDGDVTKASSD